MSLKVFSTVVFLILIAHFVCGQQLNVEIQGEADFGNLLNPVCEAGDDYNSYLEDESGVFISVLYSNVFDYLFNPNKKWSIYVHKSDVDWPSDFSLKVRRTGNGSRVWFGSGVNINHGVNYQEITNNPVYFFRGRHGISNIPLAFQLSGFSVTMGAGDFETSIVFTVYDDW
ncbi:MAG: hypothetical protein ACP5D9_05530 [Mariniphaga sp.]